MTRHEQFPNDPNRRPPYQGQAQTIEGVSLSSSVRGPIWLGTLLLALFVLGFCAWGFLAPISGGAVAPGIISPEGNRRVVQHLEGGIISKLHVRDGDYVNAGQPLMLLDDTQSRSAYDVLLNQQRTLLAMQFRLESEGFGRAAVKFPEELQGPEARAIVEAQLEIFSTRRDLDAARKRVLRQRIEQLKEQIKGYDAQVESASLQLKLIAQELQGKELLQNKGLLPLPVLLAVKRAEAEIGGRRGEYIASIAQAKQQIGETELQLLSMDAERAEKIAAELAKTRADLATVNERLFASNDILKRTTLVAPVSGTVVNLRFKTKGGVIQRGEHILDIVPADDKLLIEARVSPTDIDVVHTGLTAQVHLSAYTSRNLPRIQGTVLSVSADRLVDEKTGQPYYLARVEVSSDELNKLMPNVELVPGMPAEVLIVTGERTMFEYLFQPFLDAVRRSFREV